MRNETLDVRSYMGMPDMNGLPHLKVKSDQFSPCMRRRRPCPRKKRIEKEAVAQSSQEEEEEGEGFHQAELKVFDHHMPIQLSRRAQG